MRIRLVKGLALALGCVLVLVALLSWRHFLATPMVVDAPQVLELKAGSGLFSLQQQLLKCGLLKHPSYFAWLAKYNGAASRLRAGEYLLPIGIKPQALLDLLSSDQVIQHELTLIEGWNYRQVLDALAKDPAIMHSLQDLSPQQIKLSLGIAEPYIEGLFFPDTYRFTKGTTDILFLQRAYRLMQQLLTREWAERQAGLPYSTPYQALIVASLIEKEAKLPEERALIAGVIVKRLQIGMRLQIDASVMYGLAENYKGSLHKSDLRLDTPYNTYLHAGLPPTPIALPSQASIHAALHPIVTDSIFYMARGDGGHCFSANLSDHNKALQQYLNLRRLKNTTASLG
jgi:UPF0755 protein